MIWFDHLELKDKHAILSPSLYSWINYKPEEMAAKLTNRYYAVYRQTLGTILHEFCADAIELKTPMGKSIKNLNKSIKLYMKGKGYSQDLIDALSILPDHVYQTVILYVNDCIDFRMQKTEQPLKYNDICFGHADSVMFDGRVLRVSDLKTGDTPAHMEQLIIYDALFCIEYKFDPREIKVENRIYQFGTIQEMIDVPIDILKNAMDVIIRSSKFIDTLKNGGIVV